MDDRNQRVVPDVRDERSIKVDETIILDGTTRVLMPLDRRAVGLVGALIAALAVQVPMFPGTGLETRNPSSFAPWFQGISMLLFPALMVAAVLAVAIAWRRPRVSAYLSIAFSIGMIAVTLVDVTGTGGQAPPAPIVVLELIALLTMGLTLVFGMQFLRRTAGGQSSSALTPPSVAT